MQYNSMASIAKDPNLDSDQGRYWEFKAWVKIAP